MKKVLFSLLSASALLCSTSCADEAIAPAGEGEAMVNFTVQLNDGNASRAISDGLKATQLFYEVYAYDKDGAKPTAIDKVTTMVEKNGKLTAEVGFPLVKGQKYDIVFWAQKEGAYVTDVADKLTTINMFKSENGEQILAKANDDDRDAFTAVFSIEKVQGAQSHVVELTRPFAQVNFATTTTDIAEAFNAGLNLEGKQSKVLVKNVATQYNALTKAATGNQDVYTTFDWNIVPANETLLTKTQGTETVEDDVTYNYLATAYVLVPGDDKQSLADLEMTITTGLNQDITVKVPAAPVQRNYRTNVLGNLLTNQTDFTVEIDADFDGDLPSAEVVATAEKFLAAVENVEDGGIIKLDSDISFTTTDRTHNSGTWYDGLYYVGDKSFTIDLGGKTIDNANGAVNDYLLNFKNDGAEPNTITIKNGTLDAGTAAFCAICTSSTSTQKITINLENVNVINNMSNGSTIKMRGESVLNVKAGTKITGKNSYLGIENWKSTVNIYEGAEIYMNGTSSYNGCLVGVGGNGTVNVYGGYGEGVKGGFIAMTSGGTINVSGGKWIANTDGTVGNNSNLYVLTAQNNKYESGYAGASIINVTGGTFRGGMDAWILNDVKVEKAELNISGGNFNANPSSYVEEGYAAVEANGIWTVAEVTTANNAEELATAIANGGLISLANDINISEVINIPAGTTANIILNGNITAKETDGFVVNAGGNLTISGNGKVTSNGAPIRAIGGKIVVEGGEFTQTGAFNTTISTYRYSLDSREGGEIIVKGGTFKTNNGMINVSANSSVVIEGGNFLFDNNTTGTRHFAYISGTLTIKDGEFKGIADGDAGGEFFCGAGANGKVIVDGGKFTSLWTSGAKNNIWSSYASGSSIEINGGIFNHNGGISAQVKENTDAATKDAYPYMAK